MIFARYRSRSTLAVAWVFLRASIVVAEILRGGSRRSPGVQGTVPQKIVVDDERRSSGELCPRPPRLPPSSPSTIPHPPNTESVAQTGAGIDLEGDETSCPRGIISTGANLYDVHRRKSPPRVLSDARRTHLVDKRRYHLLSQRTRLHCTTLCMIDVVPPRAP